MKSSAWYKSFAELSMSESEGSSYKRTFKHRRSKFAIIAPHGGGIEPGTTEIARAIAGSWFSYYTFDGLRQEGNELLHITSSLFDDPQCLQLISDSKFVIAIHGCSGDDQAIHIGGLHEELKIRLIDAMLIAGFDARPAGAEYAGVQPQNICNRGCSGQGVQLEISEGLRRAMFKSLKRQDRKITTHVFQNFVTCVRRELMSAAGGA